MKPKKVQDNPKFHGKEVDETLPIPANVKARREKSQKLNAKKDKKKKKETKSTKSASKKDTPDLDVATEKNHLNQTLVLKKRKKKGKKPKVKKTNIKKNVHKVGKVEKDRNKFYPGTVDFAYTAPTENWISCFGNEKDIDFGNKSRLLADEAKELL